MNYAERFAASSQANSAALSAARAEREVRTLKAEVENLKAELAQSRRNAAGVVGQRNALRTALRELAPAHDLVSDPENLGIVYDRAAEAFDAGL